MYTVSCIELNPATSPDEHALHVPWRLQLEQFFFWETFLIAKIKSDLPVLSACNNLTFPFTTLNDLYLFFFLVLMPEFALRL